MPRVGFEPTIPASERAKTVHALKRSATVIGAGLPYKIKNTFPSPYYLLLKSHITHRHFQIKYNNSYSNCYQVKL
jgi:hypothetical protein